MWNDERTDDLLAAAEEFIDQDQPVPVDLLATLEERGVSVSRYVDPGFEPDDYADRLAFTFGNRSFA